MDIYKNLSLEDLPNEEWRDVVGYEGLYQVSNLGRVKMLEREVLANKSIRQIKAHLIKQYFTSKKYLFVTLWSNNKSRQIMVHRLVLESFKGSPHTHQECNHINEKRDDNRIDNLEWATHIDNLNYGSRTEKHRAAMTNHPSMSKGVIQYDLSGNFICEYPSLREAARNLGFYMGNILECCKGRYKSTHGFIFKYK